MSAIDAGLKENPLVLLLGGGDLSEPALLVKLLDSPLVFILDVLFRLNRPMTWGPGCWE